MYAGLAGLMGCEVGVVVGEFSDPQPAYEFALNNGIGAKLRPPCTARSGKPTSVRFMRSGNSAQPCCGTYLPVAGSIVNVKSRLFVKLTGM